jgi:hypothetical protein
MVTVKADLVGAVHGMAATIIVDLQPILFSVQLFKGIR